MKWKNANIAILITGKTEFRSKTFLGTYILAKGIYVHLKCSSKIYKAQAEIIKFTILIGDFHIYVSENNQADQAVKN